MPKRTQTSPMPPKQLIWSLVPKKMVASGLFDMCHGPGDFSSKFCSRIECWQFTSIYQQNFVEVVSGYRMSIIFGTHSIYELCSCIRNTMANQSINLGASLISQFVLSGKSRLDLVFGPHISVLLLILFCNHWGLTHIYMLNCANQFNALLDMLSFHRVQC